MDRTRQRPWLQPGECACGGNPWKHINYSGLLLSLSLSCLLCPGPGRRRSGCAGYTIWLKRRSAWSILWAASGGIPILASRALVVRGLTRPVTPGACHRKLDSQPQSDARHALFGRLSTCRRTHLYQRVRIGQHTRLCGAFEPVSVILMQPRLFS